MSKKGQHKRIDVQIQHACASTRSGSHVYHTHRHTHTHTHTHTTHSTSQWWEGELERLPAAWVSCHNCNHLTATISSVGCRQLLSHARLPANLGTSNECRLLHGLPANPGTSDECRLHGLPANPGTSHESRLLHGLPANPGTSKSNHRNNCFLPHGYLPTLGHLTNAGCCMGYLPTLGLLTNAGCMGYLPALGPLTAANSPTASLAWVTCQPWDL